MLLYMRAAEMNTYHIGTVWPDVLHEVVPYYNRHGPNSCERITRIKLWVDVSEQRRAIVAKLASVAKMAAESRQGVSDDNSS